MKKRITMNDQLQAKQLIENGKRYIATEAWDDERGAGFATPP